MTQLKPAFPVETVGTQRRGRIASLAVFAVVLLALYGPKLGGVVDLSVAGGALGLLLLSYYGVHRPNRALATFILLVTVAAWYTLAIVLVSGADDPTLGLRAVRSLVATVVLGVVFFNFAARRLVSARSLINILISALVVNAVVVLLGIAQPAVQSTLATLYGFNKTVRPLRSFGLSAGYDTAGFLCTLGAGLAASAAYYGRHSTRTTAWYLTSLTVFATASLFTSRTAMLLTGSAMVLASFAFLKSRNRRLARFALGLLIAIGLVSIIYVLPLLLNTVTSLRSFVGLNSGFDLGASAQSYAVSDVSSWRSAMWFLPETTGELFLGTGLDPEISDVGYVILANGVGMLGLVLTIAPIIYALHAIRRMRLQRQSGQPYGQGPDETAAADTLAAFATFTLITLFLINLKNLYFLTRGYHELIVITVAFLFGLGALRLLELARSQRCESRRNTANAPLKRRPITFCTMAKSKPCSSAMVTLPWTG